MNERSSRIADRKNQHIDYVLAGAGASSADTGLDRVRLVHNALPEIDCDAIDLSASLFAKPLKAPLLISSMTGGPERAASINQNLAEAAEHLGIAFAVGSQRVSLEGGAAAGLGSELRRLAPTIPILANIGGAQLALGWGVTEAQRAIDAVAADALVVHLNPLQEAIQPEGDKDWRGVLDGIGQLVRGLAVPVVVKETGCGLSGAVVRRLSEVGVAGVEVAGAGGTNWGLIEGARGEGALAHIAAPFAGWGVPTAVAITEARAALPSGLVIGSGGIRDGLDAAKAIRLGADLVGQAANVLPAALKSSEAVVAHFDRLVAQLRIACFCTGSKDLAALRQCDATWDGGGTLPL